MCNFRTGQDFLWYRDLRFVVSIFCFLFISEKILAVTPPNSPNGDQGTATKIDEFGEEVPSEDESDGRGEDAVGEDFAAGPACDDPLEAISESLAYLFAEDGSRRLRRVPRQFRLPALDPPPSPPACPPAPPPSPASVQASPQSVVVPLPPPSSGAAPFLSSPVLSPVPSGPSVSSLPALGPSGRVASSRGSRRASRCALLAASTSSPLILAELGACTGEDAKSKEKKKLKLRKTSCVPQGPVGPRRRDDRDRRGGGGGGGGGGGRNMFGASSWAASLRSGF